MANFDLKITDVKASPTSFPVPRHAQVTPGLSYRLASRLGTTPPAAGENHDTRFEFNWLREIRHPAIESPGYV